LDKFSPVGLNSSQVKSNQISLINVMLGLIELRPL